MKTEKLFLGIRVVVDPNLPLKKTKHTPACIQMETWRFGCNCPQVDALYWVIGDVICVHPLRYEQYFKPLEKP